MTDEVQSVEVEAPVVATEEQNGNTPDTQVEAGTTETEEATEKPETEEQKRSKFQRRLDRQKAARVAAETEARILRERIQALEGTRQQEQKISGAPKLADYQDFESYAEALAEFKADQRIAARLAEREQMTAQERARAEQAKVAQTWQERQEKASDKYPDFEEVVSESDAPMTQVMAQAIVESDFGPDVAYYLANNPGEAERIASLSPIRQIAEIGKIEDKVSQPRPKKLTEAPPPINPAGSKAKAEKDPSKMTDAEFREWRKRQIAQRR